MRHRLEYAIVRALIALARVTPQWLIYWCGTLIGRLFYVCDRAHRRIAERNLARAFPVRSAGERRAIARGTFAHFGRLLFELRDRPQPEGSASPVGDRTEEGSTVSEEVRRAMDRIRRAREYNDAQPTKNYGP